MTAGELFAAIEAGAAPPVLDVRTPAEFAAGHVPGAINIPFQQVSRRTAELKAARERPLLVYCGHGPRAWMAGAALRRAGFRYISYLKGHMAAWRRAGLREERQAGAGPDEVAGSTPPRPTS
jgi:rhodanese-related sulfurtransferase